MVAVAPLFFAAICGAGETPNIATKGGDILLSPGTGGSVRVLDTATGKTPSLAESLSEIERRAEKMSECASSDRDGIADDVKLLASTLSDVVDGLKAVEETSTAALYSLETDWGSSSFLFVSKSSFIIRQASLFASPRHLPPQQYACPPNLHIPPVCARH